MVKFYFAMIPTHFLCIFLGSRYSAWPMTVCVLFRRCSFVLVMPAYGRAVQQLLYRLVPRLLALDYFWFARVFPSVYRQTMTSSCLQFLVLHTTVLVWEENIKKKIFDQQTHVIIFSHTCCANTAPTFSASPACCLQETPYGCWV